MAWFKSSKVKALDQVAELVLQNTDKAIFTTDLRGTLQVMNPAMLRLFGIEQKDWQGKKLNQLLHLRSKHDGDTIALMFQQLTDGLSDDMQRDDQITIALDDGILCYLSVKTRQMLNGSGKAIGFLFMVDDITSKRHESRMRAMRDDLNMAMHGHDFEAILQSCLNILLGYTNWRLAHLYIYDENLDQLVASNIWADTNDMMSAELRKITEVTNFHREQGVVGRVFTGKEPEWLDLTEPEALHQVRYLDNLTIKTGVFLPLKNHQVHQGVLEVFHTQSIERDADLQDLMQLAASQIAYVIETHEAEQKLIAERNKAQAASDSKSEFLANMSHEIRTPLNAIMGFGEMLMEADDVPEHAKDMLRTMQSSSVSLLTVINDILDFSKIEAGQLELEKIPFNLNVTVHDAVALFQARATEKNLELLVDYDPAIPSVLAGDPGRIRQILTNLISNAIKFTEMGHVKISFELTSETEDVVYLTGKVMDTGIGVAAENQPKIFDKFAQADGSTTRKFGGTGLGLAICQQLTKLMGGNVGIESELGKGATFYFDILLDKVAVPELAAEADLSNCRVLAVDDLADNREIFERQLEAMNVGRYATVADGLSALAEMRDAVAEGAPYDLALVDYHMPQMSGLALAQAIKKDAQLSRTRLILLTSAGARGDAKRAQDAGFAGFLTKPIPQDKLLEAMQLVLHAKPSQPLVTRHTVREMEELRKAVPQLTPDEAKPAAKPTESYSPDAKHILIVEDNSINQKVCESMLRLLGHRSTLVADGQQAIDTLVADDASFDLVLMDLQMPVKDGLEATREIRALEKEGKVKKLPIVALTANAMKGDREVCLAAGMDDYLPKPLNKKAIASMLHTYLGTPELVVTKD